MSPTATSIVATPRSSARRLASRTMTGSMSTVSTVPAPSTSTSRPVPAPCHPISSTCAPPSSGPPIRRIAGTTNRRWAAARAGLFRTARPSRFMRTRPVSPLLTRRAPGPRFPPMTYTFRAALWLHTGDAAWHFVTLPIDVADEIDDLTTGARRGFGSVRVTATIGSTTWNTSIFPDAASESFVLPIKKKVRTSEGLSEAESVQVTLRLVDPA